MNTSLLGTVLLLAWQNAATDQAPSPKTKPEASQSVSFSDAYFGLEFSHPKTWTVTKKGRDMTRFAIPIEGSPVPGELEIMRTSFHQTKDLWQSIQLQANATMRREVVRQWEQDVINVPMLSTQINFTDRGVAKTTMTGLYYTKTPSKMLVRLTSAIGDFDKLKYQFDSALESLHTIDGSAPVEDDPNYVFPVTKKPQPAASRPVLIDAGAAPKVKKPRHQTGIPLTVSTKAVTMNIPSDWTTEDVKDGHFVLHHPKLKEPIQVEVHSSLDSDRPAAALLKLSGDELAEFLPGVTREDTDPTINETGCSVSTVWRVGKNDKGNLVTFHASAEQGDFYLILNFRTTSIADAKAYRSLIRELLGEINLEATGS